MSAAPFDVRPFVARLSDGVPALRSVGLRADLAAVRSLKDFPAPCAYVLLAQERGTANPPGVAPPGRQVKVRQIAEASFGVLLAFRNYREQQGGQLADECSVLIEAVRQQLIGFVPALPAARPIQWVSGELIDYDASVGLWREVYQTQHSIGT